MVFTYNIVWCLHLFQLLETLNIKFTQKDQIAPNECLRCLPHIGP